MKNVFFSRLLFSFLKYLIFLIEWNIRKAKLDFKIYDITE